MIDQTACLPAVPLTIEVIDVPAVKVKVNLGCGQQLEEGWTGVDCVESKPGVIVHDLFTFPWPFADESVDEAFSSHFFEHVPGRLRFKWMDELWRILKPGAKAIIITPYYSSMRASQDPTHEWPPVSEASYLYFNRPWREMNGLTHGPYEMKCNFDYQVGIGYDQSLLPRADDYRAFAAKHYMNAISDIFVTLEKKA